MRDQMMKRRNKNTHTIGRHTKHSVDSANEQKAKIVESILLGVFQKKYMEDTIP